MTAPLTTTIKKSIFLPVSPAVAWDYLTKSDKLALWFFATEADLADGEDFAMIGKADDGSATRPCWGTVLDMDPFGHLRYHFTAVPLAGAMTVVDWRLEESDGGTQIRLEHSGFENAGDAADSMASAFDLGWDKHIARLHQAI